MAALIELFLDTHIGNFLVFLFTSGLIVWILRTYHQYLAAKRANHHEERARLLEGTVGKLIEQNSELIDEKVEQRVQEELEKKRLEQTENDALTRVEEPSAIHRDSTDQLRNSSTDGSGKVTLMFFVVGICVVVFYYSGQQSFVPVSSEAEFRLYVDNVILENDQTSEKLYIGPDRQFISFEINGDIYGSWYWSNEDKLCFALPNGGPVDHCVKVAITSSRVRFSREAIDLIETSVWKFPTGYESGI